MKDFTRNYKSIYTTLGASNHSSTERQPDDYYATDPKAVELLLEKENFSNNIWECACGEGHISKVLLTRGYNVRSTDLIYRGFGEENPLDFLKTENTDLELNIITNPPYKFAQQFVEKAITSIADGFKVAMFLKLQFLEGKSRKQMFKKYPPKIIYVSSSRLKCAINGNFEKLGSSAVAYAWYVWEKGYSGNTVIDWIN